MAMVNQITKFDFMFNEKHPSVENNFSTVQK